MRNFIRLMAVVEKIFLVAAAVMLVFMAMLTFLDVVGRYAFNAPLGGAFELVGIGMAILIFGALPEVTARNEHVSVTLVKFLPQPIQAFLRVVMALIVAGSFGVLAWCLLKHAARLYDFGDYAMFTGVPFAPVALFMAVCAGLAAIFRLARLLFRLDDTVTYDGTHIE